MKIISLVDNKSNKIGLRYEHGLSLYIETKKHKLLFDLGAGTLFADNALSLGIDLKVIDTVIISHGHYDHGGGLAKFLSINDKAIVYIKKQAFADYYSERTSGTAYIGLDKALSQNPRFVFTDDDMTIDDELELFSDVKITDERFSLNKKLKVKIGNELLEDDFKHEQNLIIKSSGKRILVAGCAHNGITNIIRKFIDIVGSSPDYVIAGFHLSNPASGKNEEDAMIYALADKLNEWNTEYFTCHCTGVEPFEKLKEKLNNKLDYLAAGDIINI